MTASSEHQGWLFGRLDVMPTGDEQECPFCHDCFPGIPTLCRHLYDAHKYERVQVGRVNRLFHFYFPYLGSGYRVNCVCGESFSYYAGNAAPAFQAWVASNVTENNSFLAHLRREGGLKAHLEDERQKELLRKIEGLPPDERRR